VRLTILIAPVALAELVAAPQAGAEAPPACGPVSTGSYEDATPMPIADDAVITATLEVTGAGVRH
jgi:hypothetical protein